jgi:hypothetical protein
MSEAVPRADAAAITSASPGLEALLAETCDMPCAELFALVVRQLAGLDPEVSAEVRPLGVLFRYRQANLCELSLYGELFIARMGPELAVEVRVRSEDLALLVLHEVLRTYMQRKQSATDAPRRPGVEPPPI